MMLGEQDYRFDSCLGFHQHFFVIYFAFANGKVRFGWMVSEEIAIGARGLRFDSRAGQIRHIVAYGLPQLRCFLVAVLPRQ